MPYITNPLTQGYGNRHYGAGGTDGFSGAGYGGASDFTGGIGSIARAFMARPNASQQALAQMDVDYKAALAAKTRNDAISSGNGIAASGRISDLFKQAANNAGHVNDPVVTDDGPSNTGHVAQQFMSSLPARIAAETPYVSAADAKVLPDTYRFMMANSGAANGAPTFGTSAITRAVVGAGGNEGDVKGAILADQPATQQALSVAPTETQVKGSVLQALTQPDQRIAVLGQPGFGANKSQSEAVAFDALPAAERAKTVGPTESQQKSSILEALTGPDQRVAVMGQPAFGPTESQTKGGVISTLSPADQRTAALGPAGAGSFAPVDVTVPGPDGKPMAVVGVIDHRTGAISVPNQSGPASGSITAAAIGSPQNSPNYDTKLSPEDEAAFQSWKQQNAPNDSGADYDLRGAFKSGLSPAENGHWPDTYKKPNHPTFSDQSIYAKDRPDLAGHWDGDNYVPATKAAPTPFGLPPKSAAAKPSGIDATNQKFATDNGAQISKEWQGIRATANSSDKAIGALDRTDALLKSGQMTTGKLANLQSNMQAWAEGLGVKGAFTQAHTLPAMQAEAAGLVMSLVPQLHTRLTNQELTFLQQMKPNVANTPQANLLLSSIQRKVFQQAVDDYASGNKFIKQNGGPVSQDGTDVFSYIHQQHAAEPTPGMVSPSAGGAQKVIKFDEKGNRL